MKTMHLEQAETRIPTPLLNKIAHIEQCIANGTIELPAPKIAAFDLDNTLLDGDVGDALFARLKLDGKPIPLTWAEYQRMIKEKGKLVTYSKVVTVMAGIPVETVEETTRRIMKSTAPFLEFEGVTVPVPRADPIMLELVSYLDRLGYEVYIISATNEYSVKVVAEDYFGIPGSRAIGMQPTIIMDNEQGPVLGEKIREPVTVVEGKVDAYRRYIGPTPPLITGGDSTTDIPMLNLTHPQGLIIWKGKNEKGYESVKKQLHYPDTAYLLKI
ncbi:MAG: haloacid dehalogenase-like hydrolase [bacterium]|nr:haloacid dehalogenase-like hydrolase [bacterium]